jgi:hypothetical protein
VWDITATYIAQFNPFELLPEPLARIQLGGIRWSLNLSQFVVGSKCVVRSAKIICKSFQAVDVSGKNHVNARE